MVDIRRNQALQSAFVRWGGAQILRFPVGVAAALTSQEIARATWPVPAEWGLLLTARATNLAAVNIAIAFVVRAGVGSTIAIVDRVVTLTPLAPTADVLIPSIPGATIAALAIGTPTAGPPAEVVVEVAMLATPLFYDVRLLEGA